MSLLPFEERQFTVLLKQKADGRLGTKPEERLIDDLLQTGVITLNKPKGPSSHMAAEYVKKVFRLTKAGHGGTLDPAVTGVLPVALGRSTKVLQTLLPAGKEYVCLMRLHDDIPEKKIRKALDDLVGVITQMPPVRSAVKRQERQRSIYYVTIIEVNGRHVLFRVGCQGGTYVRKLCHDLGKSLGSSAHMAQLVRTKAGPFTDENQVSLQDLEDALGFYQKEKNEKFLRYCVRPVESAVQHLPKVVTFDEALNSLTHGSDLKVPGVSLLDSDIKKEDLVVILSLKGELVALGTAMMSADEVMKNEKGLFVKTSKVFMPSFS